METTTYCYKCGKNLSIASGSIISRSEECEHCRADVRVCRNCRHFDPKAYNECKEPQAERVLDKEKANFCDYFFLIGKEGDKNLSGGENIKAKLDALFK